MTFHCFNLYCCYRRCCSKSPWFLDLESFRKSWKIEEWAENGLQSSMWNSWEEFQSKMSVIWIEYVTNIKSKRYHSWPLRIQKVNQDISWPWIDIRQCFYSYSTECDIFFATGLHMWSVFFFCIKQHFRSIVSLCKTSNINLYFC